MKTAKKSILIISLSLLPWVITSSAINKVYVERVAGIVHKGFADGPISVAQFNWPTDIVSDNKWNIYVADFNNNRIRKISFLKGTVTTLAGSGVKGYADGVGLNTQFNGPNAITLDREGNIYVADAGNARIRKITQKGEVSTIAGSGSRGIINGEALEASFVYPTDIEFDNAGNLYIVDRGGHNIRKLNNNRVVSVVAGSGIGVPGFRDGPDLSARFHDPLSITLDKEGNLYVTDAASHAIRQITPDGVVSTLAGGQHIGFGDGLGKDARFEWPTGISINSKGELFVAEGINNRIRKVLRDGTVTTFAGNGRKGFIDGPVETAEFNFPTGVKIDSMDNIYISDSGNNSIRKISVTKGMIVTKVGR